ncbi:hypothetical protein D3C71_1370500 [compost metagenome]
MNLHVIKEYINDILLYLDNRIEESGQCGEFELVGIFEQNKACFVRLSEDLKAYNNSDVHLPLLSRIFTEHFPYFEVSLLKEYIELLQIQKKEEIKQRQSDLEKLNLVATSLDRIT